MLDKIYASDRKVIVLLSTVSLVISLIVCYVLVYVSDVSQERILELMKHFTSNVITFVSISFGFYLTSLSMLFSSQYIKELNVRDKYKDGQLVIQTIKEYFRLAIYCALLTIIVAFSVYFIVSLFNFFSTKILFIVLFSVLISIFLENFLFVFFLLKTLLKALMIEAAPENMEEKIDNIKE